MLGTVNPSVLLRSWFGCLLGGLPLLALLLTPALMRSRAGGEGLLGIGVLLLAALLTGAFLLAPTMTSWFAPARGSWAPPTAHRAARAVWREHTGPAVVALLLGLGVYALGQVAGYAVGIVLPPVLDDPTAGPGQSPWVIDYPAYAIQAAVVYLVTTAAIALYGVRLRILHLHHHAGARTRPADRTR